MKKIIAALISFLFIASLLTVQTGAIGETLRSGNGTPVIDGVIDAVWKTASRQKFKYVVDGDLDDGGGPPGSCSAYVSSLWDEGALYFLLELTDNDFMNEGDGEFDSDYVQVYIDEADLFDKTWQNGQVSFKIYPYEDGRVEIVYGQLGEGTQAAYTEATNTKRIVEIKYIPTQFKTGMNMSVLVDFRFNDVYKNPDGENALAYSLTWSDEINEGNLDSSNWSYLKPGASASEGFSDPGEAAASIGQPLIEGYHFIDGTYGYDGERAKNLFDGDVGTKFCTPELPASATARLGGEFIITGIIMATANDTASYSGRNPDDWKIEASADQSNWTVIAKGDDSFLKGVNFTYFAKEIESDGQGYKFIRFTNKDCKDGLMQISELLVCGIKSTASQEEIDALMNKEPLEPITAEDVDYLPIVRGKNSFGGKTEAIAAPEAPQETNGGISANTAAGVIVLSFAVLLIAFCFVIAALQARKGKK